MTNIVLKDIIGYTGANEIISNFKFSGDWEIDHINLFNKLESYYYDTVGVYNDYIKKAVKRTVNEPIVAHYAEISFVVDYCDDIYEEEVE